MSEEKGVVFNISSGVSRVTQEPYLMVTVKEKGFSVSIYPDEARNLAMNLLMHADSAESDAFLVASLHKRLNADDKTIEGILEDLRNWRAETEGQYQLLI